MSSLCAKTSTAVKGDILIVDDTPVNLQVLFDMLVEQQYKVRIAPTGELALRNAQIAPPDLILLDIMMPDLSGYEICKQLKANPALCDIPIIFISAIDQPQKIVKAFEIGGVDFVTKPFQCEEVLARVSTHMTIYQLKRELAIANKELQKTNLQLQQEVQTRRFMEIELTRLAKTDQLTNILNRHALFNIGEQEVVRAYQNQVPLAIIMLDIDNFKQINDQHGHFVGDLAIQQTAQILRERLRQIDHIGRYGGDEFVIILPETDLASAQQMAEQLRLSVFHQDILKHPTHKVSISMGIAGIWQDSTDVMLTFETLLICADQGLYAAKDAGRNCIKTFRGNIPETAGI
ncbi:MAG: diguanylate cyclase [Leptolyngbya sp. SIO3F4]|nr:diguanylate cyclase [Leptolyngbya sp. SIO3F4]